MIRSRRALFGLVILAFVVGFGAYFRAAPRSSGRSMAAGAKPTKVLFSPPAAPLRGAVSVSAGAPAAAEEPPASGATEPSLVRLSSVDWTSQLRDELCACKDTACLREVNARYTAELGLVRFDPSDREAVSKAFHDGAECKAKLLNAG